MFGRSLTKGYSFSSRGLKPMKSKARVKTIILLTAALIGLVTALLLAMPLWFPWLLGPAGKHYGLRYARYIREGYSRFALESVVYTNRNVRVQAARIEGFTPGVWVWKHLRNDTRSTYARA